MREKRVNLVVLTCSLLVATCASVSYCFVTSGSSVLDRYVAVISSAIPIFLSGQISPASAATVWIPSDDAVDTDGSVHDEFQEVAHVFARPGVRVVKGKEEETTQQAVPWTSLKDEWKIYEKIQNSKRKSPADKLKKKYGEKAKEPVRQAENDEGSSEEEDDGDEDEEEDEGGPPQGQFPQGDADGEGGPPPGQFPQADGDDEGDDEGSSEEDDEPTGARTTISNPLPDIISKAAAGGGSFPPDDENPVFVKKAKKSDTLPLAFFGQQNHDDDEKDYQKDQATLFKRKKSQKKESPSRDEEEDDVSGSNEQAASVEDYADYAVDDDDDAENEDENGPKNNNPKKDGMSFDDIPLAIREMILNDLANQNNGTGYHPNLTPKVTGGSKQGSTENDDNSGENSSEEEDDNNAAEVVPIGDPNDPDPTPPAPSKPKKGDDEDQEYADGGGKKGKGKKKKGKKKKGGWGWKPQGWGNVHIAPGWGDHHHDKGWGWHDKHDGVLEQLVKGSTWERVLQYYHWKRDEAHKGWEAGHHDHHHHDHGHGAPFDHHHHQEDHGWGWQDDKGIKKIVKKAFKGSFWERAVHTYAHYKENQAKNPKKPITLIDLDTDHGHGHHRR